MGRHSRKGPAAPVADTGQREAVGQGPGTGRRRRGPGQEPSQAPRPYDTQGRGPQDPAAPGHQGGYGTPAHGTPRHRGGYETPAAGTPRYQGGYDTPAAGTPRHQGASDTPMHGTPRYQGPYDPAADGAFVRGGHPVHDEGAAPAARYPYEGQAGAFIPAPRREATPEPGQAGPESESTSTGQHRRIQQPARGGGLGRTFTGIAAAAITTVLAVVVAGQVTDRDLDGTPQSRAADESADRVGAESPASRSDDRVTPAKPAPAAPPTYEQLMTRQFPIDPKLKGSGDFEAVPGFDRAPGKGRKIRYRVDVEKGLGLDGALFAQAVQKTLNDERSWAGKGEMTFERISSGDPEFVVTLASPGTTGTWCAKSGLDTTVDNVSCDSASTQRVMINAFRWAQGSVTFGAKAMYAYRQMLINHEVGHRLGHSHVSCGTPGALAPVMQQQTKSLDIDGIKCRPNPWVHPGS
ncbi:DUF3152 domain-containing protein [Streptomyces sp. NPDC085481]|uniref:DUF3152 domain-containing protein n=1 Tax=Streptomyces sp. NPDC085481 TaxID=3365727 RepID=UPI0037D24954